MMKQSIGKDFETTPLYKLISKNDVSGVLKLIEQNNPKNQNKVEKKEVNNDDIYRKLSSNADTYLHIAISKQCDLKIIQALVPKVRLGQVNDDGRTAFETAVTITNAKKPLSANTHERAHQIAIYHREFILECIRDGDFKTLEELSLDGWKHWPVKGVPEIEEFEEAPIYLTQFSTKKENGFFFVSSSDTDNVLPIIYSKNFIKNVDMSSFDEWKTYMRYDILGMNILHKAVMFKDYQSVVKFLKWPVLLQGQDNMGRTPYHFASAYGEENQILKEIENSNVLTKEIKQMADKKGFTAEQYKLKQAKLDTQKIRALCAYICNCLVIASLFEDLECHELYTDDSDFSTLAFNCLEQPLLDASGRNILHKAVIYGKGQYMSDIIKIDTDNKLYRGKDLWGRTPLHYAHMVEDVFPKGEILTKKKYPLSQQVINEVQGMKDEQGKTIDDFDNMFEDEAKREEMSTNLVQTLGLLARLPFIVHSQQAIVEKMVASVEDKTRNDVIDAIADDDSDQEDDNRYYDNLVPLLNASMKVTCYSMQTILGVPLVHLSFALQDKMLIRLVSEELYTEEIDIWSYTDYRNQTVECYAPVLPPDYLELKVEKFSKMFEDGGEDITVEFADKRFNNGEEDDSDLINMMNEKWINSAFAIKNEKGKILVSMKETTALEIDQKKILGDLKSYSAKMKLALLVTGPKSTEAAINLSPAHKALTTAESQPQLENATKKGHSQALTEAELQPQLENATKKDNSQALTEAESQSQVENTSKKDQETGEEITIKQEDTKHKKRNTPGDAQEVNTSDGGDNTGSAESGSDSQGETPKFQVEDNTVSQTNESCTCLIL